MYVLEVLRETNTAFGYLNSWLLHVSHLALLVPQCFIGTRPDLETTIAASVLQGVHTPIQLFRITLSEYIP
jgi:hypothetical protein